VNEDQARITAIVKELLPNAMVRVELPGGRGLTGHVAREARALLTRLVPGDEVDVEVSEFDSGLCRIVGRPRGTRGR
jgi:translation initiation factor IF-1